MKILYLSADRGIPIRGHKGAAVHIRAITAAFSRLGHEVTIITPNPGPDDGPEPDGNLVHVPLPVTHKPALPDEESRDRQSQNYNAVLVDALMPLLEREKFDLLYERYSLWSDTGSRLAHTIKLPFVLEVNAPLLEEAAQYRHLSNATLAAKIEKKQFGSASLISVVSDNLRDYVLERGGHRDRVIVQPNGVNPEQFHPAVRGGAVHHRHELQGKIIVGFVGRARPWHDLPTLIKAVARLHREDERYHLLLVGQMPDDISTQIAVHGLSQATTVTGPVHHDEVPFYIAACDVAVSSHNPADNFYFSPLKLFEYLACGVPTVAADLGQPATIIEDGKNGYLYRPGDPASLADRIQYIIANPAHARQIAWQGAVMVLEDHTWEGNARAIMETVSGPAQDIEGLVMGKPAGFSKTSSGITARKNGHANHACTTSGQLPPTLPILDRKLRQRLFRATRADLARPLLERHLPKSMGRQITINDISILKYKPGRRCVIQYKLSGLDKKTGTQICSRTIGKVFRDERGLRLHRLHKLLRHGGFGQDHRNEIFIPDSIAYIPEMRMQLQEAAPGQTLNDLVLQTSLVPYLRRTAKALARLHQLNLTRLSNGAGPFPVSLYLLGDELANLDRFSAEILNTRPAASAGIHSLRASLFAWADELPPLHTPVPVHRDFYYSQVLADAQRLTLIDFDLFALGDPAIDVANFIAHLYFLGLDKFGDLEHLAPEAEFFLAAYSRYQPIDDEFRKRLAFYKVSTFFRLMNVVVARPGLKHCFEPLMAQTAASLEAVLVA